MPKLILDVFQRAFIIYTTIWAVIASADYYGLEISFPNPWIFYFLSHIIISLLVAIIISASEIYIIIKESNNISIYKNFKGIWNAVISDDKNTKIDKWTITTVKDSRISGKIKRETPKNDKAKEWFFTGFIVNDQMQIAYRQKNIIGQSHGCVILKKSSDDFGVYNGFYYRYNDSGDIKSTEIKLTKLSKITRKNIMSSKKMFKV